MGRTVVTGARGFLGSHLCQELSRAKHDVIGVDLGADRIEYAQQTISLAHSGDLAEAVRGEHQRAPVDMVIHCAFVNRKPADQSDADYCASALARDLPLFTACADLDVPVLLVSSSAVYGALAFTNRAIREDDPIHPVTIYGVAKASQEMQAGFLAASKGLRVAAARLFNLCGPGQKEGMLIPDWVSRVAAIASGATPRLVVRNRATTRDFVDVRDAACALRLMAESFVPGDVANVATGKAVSLTELSDELQRLCPVPYEVIETDPVPSGTDPVVHCGAYDHIAQRYGWSPTIGWQASLREIWQTYRRDVQ